MLLQTKINNRVETVDLAAMKCEQGSPILRMLSKFNFHWAVGLRYNFENMCGH